MSTATPRVPDSRPKEPSKSGARRTETNKIYANPLPLLFVDSQAGPRSLLGLLGLGSSRSVENPHCNGHFDPTTRSVWVIDPDQSKILWQRGFFGKGNLSRSEPSWLTRRLNVLRSGGNYMTPEEVTAKRRAERDQFKQDRARAIAAVAAQAEEIFASEGRVVVPTLSGPEIPSAATWKPSRQLAEHGTSNQSPPIPDQEVEIEDVEHLQLTLQEAFFLVWNFDCLTIWDSDKVMSMEQIWKAFKSCSEVQLIPNPRTHLDNSFIIHYLVYHHYRSLGWVVRGGVKFCVDYLLYKRGPVFSHAEFAVVVYPVFEDSDNENGSPADNDTMSTWQWLSTINRTLILTYVTIPPISRLPRDVLESPVALARYSIREVVIKRWIPARMRG
ncbi:hypothetical protein BDN72DRAFT_599271 [Pluteus cervinus]|uniref:Uncharacterized protein n=1 Tax=Pluteus cervinus TaxID=181527 RepID=A0ACD3B9X8_9AGAR|nr:hypothetical protein BDN72DRAFT_599271 [Pluteus cervinus]